MDRRIIRPMPIYRIAQNRQELLGGETGYPNAANVFAARSFVVLTSNALVAVASAGILACGYVQDDSKATATVSPPEAIFGDRHFPLNLNGQIFAISVTDGTGHVTEALGAPQLSEVAVGTAYGILRPTTGTYAGYQFLDVDNTTNDFFEVVEKPAEYDGVAQLSTAFNPVVFVKILPAAIQAVQ